MLFAKEMLQWLGHGAFHLVHLVLPMRLNRRYKYRGHICLNGWSIVVVLILLPPPVSSVTGPTSSRFYGAKMIYGAKMHGAKNTFFSGIWAISILHTYNPIKSLVALLATPSWQMFKANRRSVSFDALVYGAYVWCMLAQGLFADVKVQCRAALWSAIDP
jgi:hypothetical protein